MKRSGISRDIRQVVEQVVRLVNPLRIMLFGSVAAGRIGPDSDLDFLLVVSGKQQPDKVLDRLNTGVRRGSRPCDFMVVTPKILRRHRNNPGLVCGEILKKGRLIYGLGHNPYCQGRQRTARVTSTPNSSIL